MEDIKSNKEVLAEKIVNYYKKGYSRREILTMMQEAIISDYNGEEDKFFEFVKRAIDEARSSMSEEEINKIAETRKELLEITKQQKIKEVAVQVKERLDSPLYSGMPREKLSKVANMVAKLTGIKTDKVREYFKTIYPDLYQAYMANLRTSEFYEEMAKRIIRNDLPKSAAERAYGYSAMLKYLSKNNPELHVKLLESFASHDANVTRNAPVVSSVPDVYNNKNLLIEIILEYRIPFKEASEFISKYSKLFLMNKDQITPEEFMHTIGNKRPDMNKATEWYVTELSMYYDPEKYDESMKYKIEKFRDFERKFALIASDINNVTKFVKAETAINLTSVHKKVNDQFTGSHYKFDNDDIRKILKYAYKYGLGEQDLQRILGIPRISRSRLAENFIPGDIDDQILLEGYNKLTEYKNDVSYAFKVGRK